MENRNGLCTDISLARATGGAERTEAIRMLDRQRHNGIRPTTLGCDKGYDVRRFIEDLRERDVTPHVAQQITWQRRSRIDGRTTRHPGYAISQRCRKKVEEIFGWMKTVGGFRKTRYRGQARTSLWSYLVAAAYNLIRMAKLIPAS
jgi:IS5 family transposase